DDLRRHDGDLLRRTQHHEARAVLRTGSIFLPQSRDVDNAVAAGDRDELHRHLAGAADSGRRLLPHDLRARCRDLDRADLARRNRRPAMNYHARISRGAAPAPDTLIARAELLIPALRERAADVDRNSRLAPEIVQRLREEGFFRILQPIHFGGYGM